MKSVRFSDELERKLIEVAELEGTTQSEIIRRAIETEYERVTKRRLDHEIKDLVGKCSLGGGRARASGDEFRRVLSEEKESA